MLQKSEGYQPEIKRGQTPSSLLEHRPGEGFHSLPQTASRQKKSEGYQSLVVDKNSGLSCCSFDAGRVNFLPPACIPSRKEKLEGVQPMV